MNDESTKNIVKKKQFRPLMAALLSALLGPGVGQLYNREFKKGGFLILVSLGGFFWFTRVITEQLARFLLGPAETWDRNPAQFKEAMFKVFSENPSAFVTFYLLMILVWAFSVIDAYLTAKKKRREIGLPHENSDAPC